MASDEINDIVFIEKSAEEREVIKNTCSQCEYFEVISNIHDVPVKIDEVVSVINFEYLNPTCKKSNQVLVFDQMKSFQTCPESKW